jgi:DNA-binding IclR family transcriptional regulator
MKSLYAPPEGPTTGVQPISSALKTLALLDIVGRSPQPLRLADLARAAQGSRATIYQKLLTLVRAGWIEQVGQGAYRLSLHAALMGEAALRQANVPDRAEMVMQSLVAEVGETVSLTALNGIGVQILKRVVAPVVVRAQVRMDTLLSLDQSSSGRVLTAFASLEVRDYLKKKGGVLASEALLREIKRQGYAISTGKDLPGVRSTCVPVFDASGNCTTALSVVAPNERFAGAKYLKQLRRASAELTALGAGKAS